MVLEEYITEARKINTQTNNDLNIFSILGGIDIGLVVGKYDKFNRYESEANGVFINGAITWRISHVESDESSVSFDRYEWNPYHRLDEQMGSGFC